MCRLAFRAQTGLALALLAAAWGSGGLPLPAFVGATATMLFLLGLTFGNLSAIALAPLGHIAGTASPVTAALSTAVNLAVAAAIGGAYDGTVLAVLAGYAATGVASLALLAWGEHRAS